MPNTLQLTGLDAQNPLGFLAALGLLRIVDEHARRNALARPSLAFVDDGVLHARIGSALESVDALIEVVLSDALARGDDALLQLCYDDHGAALPAGATGKRDLKPSPETARALLDRVADGPRLTSDLAAAFFSELVQDNNGNTKPTALHFTAGQQQFLDMVDALRRGVVAEDLHEALLGPWRGESTLPSLSWDATMARQYALRAGNPSKEKRGSVAGANYLAVFGLSYLPVTVQRGKLVTTCVVGGWKDSIFTWPTWSRAATSNAAASLLRMDLRRLSSRERAALGISHVFAARITRSDQGGYGGFSPAEVVFG
ncbi:MAG: hypothetical protein U0168_18115 [Nannocystaceae bacterium]